MAAGDLALNILISAQTGGAGSAIQGLAGQLKGLNPAMGGIAAVALTAGAAVIGIGAAAMKTAGDFQSMTTTLVTGAGESAANLDLVRQGILTVSVATGTSTKQLVDGMFMVESAGYHGAAGLNVLQVAAQGAKVGNADLGVTANAVTTFLTDYHMSGTQAAQAMNALTTTVASGKTHLQDLAGAMGSVLPLASSLGISFPQVGGAIAVMTNAGMSAQRASMNLANAIRSLAAPGGVATKALKSVGISTQELNDVLTHQGLQAALQMINEDVGKKFPAGSSQWAAAMKQIMGGATGLNVALMLGGKNMDTYKNNIANITNAMSPAQKAVLGWSMVQQDFNFKVDQAKAALNAFMITLGTKLLPIFGPLVGQVTSLITALGHLVAGGGQLSPMIQNIIGMAGIMAANWQDAAQQIQGIVGGPLAQFGRTMGSLLPGFISQFLRATNDVQLVMQDIGIAVASIAAPALRVFGQAFTGVQGFIETALNAIEGQFLPALHNLIAAIAPIIAGIVQWLASSNALGIAFNVLSAVVQVVVGAISVLVNIVAALITFFSQTAIGVAAFRAILIILGVVIGTIGIVILTTVIPAFIAWVAGAVAVGIANVIAFAPIVLIVLAIVAVVTVVVLVITHWGQIVGWLGGIWSAFVSWFGSAMSAVGTFFHNIWEGLLNFFKAVWNGIVAVARVVGMILLAVIIGPIGLLVIYIVQHWNQVKAFLAGIWNGIVNIAKTVWNAIVGAISAAIQTVVGWFSWLYNHNYYFQALVDTIRAIISAVVAWLVSAWQAVSGAIVAAWNAVVSAASAVWNAITGAIQAAVQAVTSWLQSAWSAVVSWLTSAWSAVSSVATSVWNAITSAIRSAIQAAVSWLRSAWTSAVSFLAGIWNSITSSVSAMWAKISSFFGNAWATYIARPLASLWTSFTNWFNNLKNAAIQWGVGLIQGFINGIMSMVSNVAGAAQNIIGTVGKFLGFHSPAAYGEGRYIEQWGQGMVKGFVKGMAAAQPLLNAQVSHMITAPNSLAYSANRNNNAFALNNSSHTIIVQMQPSDVYLDNKKVGESVMKYANKQVHGQGGYRNG